MDILLVEGDNEKVFLEDYARVNGFIYKVIKFNIVESQAIKIIKRIPKDTQKIFVVFDTDVLCANIQCKANLVANIKALKKHFKFLTLHLQYENFEDEVARSCALRKNELFNRVCIYAGANNFKSCFNALKKPIDYIENTLCIDYSILWNKILEIKDDIDFIDTNHKKLIKDFTDFKKSLKSRR